MGRISGEESDEISSEVECQAEAKVEFIGTVVAEPEKRYKCVYSGCNSTFLRPSRFLRHMRIHTGERPFKCSHSGCDKAYTNSSHLKRHLSTTHDPTTRKYKYIAEECSKCSLIISNAHNLKRHYDRMHNDDKRQACSKCERSFKSKRHLEEHLTTHTGSNLYKCEKCQKEFVNVNSLRRHVRKHNENKKTYPCTSNGCSDIFEKWRDLLEHRRLNHVIEHKCKDCDKVFLNKSHLRIHGQVHNENRPILSCPYEKCPRVYYFKNNLDHHVRSKHKGKKFQCDTCKFQLSTKQKLIEHIQKIHLTKKKKPTKKGHRRRRKDASTFKKSAVSELLGLNLPYHMEKDLLERETRIKIETETPAEPINGSSNEEDTI